MIRFQNIAFAALLSLMATAVSAHEFKLGELEIDHPHSRAMLPGAAVGGGFLKIVNSGGEADRLLAVTSPVAGDVQLHDMAVENDVMKMRRIEGGIEVPAGTTVELKPGGLHVMFLKVTQPFREGVPFPATLVFEKAGSVDVEFSVDPPAGGAKEAGAEGGHAH